MAARGVKAKFARRIVEVKTLEANEKEILDKLNKKRSIERALKDPNKIYDINFDTLSIFRDKEKLASELGQSISLEIIETVFKKYGLTFAEIEAVNVELLRVAKEIIHF